jgi:hypothetical protein
MCVVYTRNLNRPSHERKNISHSDGLAIQILSKLFLFIVSPEVPKKIKKQPHPFLALFQFEFAALRRPSLVPVSLQMEK